MRLDQYIVQMGWAASRTKAQEMIERGDIRVFIKGELVPSKASFEMTENI